MPNQGLDKDPASIIQGVATQPSWQSVLTQTRNAGLGLVAGLIGGLMGVGGGVVLVPLLTNVARMGQHQAHGTSLAMVAITALASALSYGSRGFVNWPLAGVIAITAMLGAVAGARLCCFMPARHLRGLYGLVLMVFGLLMILNINALVSVVSPGADPAAYSFTPMQGVIGITAGLLGGILGIGGGPILVPLMVLFLDLPQHVAQGVSVAVIVPTATAGVITHYRYGNVVLSMVLSLALAAIIGAWAGVWLAALLEASQLQQIFGLLLLGLSLQTFIKMRK
ncbi:MAG: sulfite exporter TauE/SafE family protein [Bacteroidetes bacterium]|nr:sulfite exporter TauE/SafE family protein [Bacteroidota bacterium]